MVSPANAAEPLTLHKGSIQSLLQQFSLGISGVKQTVAVHNNRLQFIQQHTDRNHITHVRLQQQYAGFDVHGGYAITHSSRSVRSLLTTQDNMNMNGVVYRGLQEELGSPKSDFTSNAKLALKKFVSSWQMQSISKEQVRPMVYIDDNNQAHWAYKVSVLVHHDKKIPEKPTAIIDAVTYEPFIQWDDIKTLLTPVKGKGFGGNVKIGEYAFDGSNYPFLELNRNDNTEICYMETRDVKIVDMKQGNFSNNEPINFTCKSEDTDQTVFWTGYNGDGYDRVNGAFSPANDAMYSGYVIKHLFHDWYGTEVLVNQDGSPMQLVMRVHYRMMMDQEYGNAFWEGNQMTFGDGDNLFHPLVSLGIGGHEIAHGFTEQHSSLIYYGQSGGINESFSDMAAQSAEFYASGKNSWQIGREITKEDSGYDTLRYMDKPSRDGMSIDKANDYYRGLDVHYSSGVFNRMYYLLANQDGWDTRKAFDVMVKANMDYWTPYSTFVQAGCGVLSAASDLGYSVDGIKKTLSDVAIKYDSCEIN